MPSEASRKMAQEWWGETMEPYSTYNIDSLAALLDQRAEAEQERIKRIVREEVTGDVVGNLSPLRSDILRRIEEGQ